MRAAGNGTWEQADGFVDRQIGRDSLHVWPFGDRYPVDVRFLVLDRGHGHVVPLHRPDHLEIVIFESGRLGYEVEDQRCEVGKDDIIVVGDRLRHRCLPLTASQAADIPDLARLFDPQTGLPAVIPQGRNPKYLGAETIDNVDSHKVEATYTGDQVKGMLAQLSSQGDVDAVIWVGGSDHYIR